MIKSFNSQRQLDPSPSIDLDVPPKDITVLEAEYKAKGEKFDRLAKEFIKKYPHLFKD